MQNPTDAHTRSRRTPRTEIIRVRLAPAERANLEQKANHAHRTMSEMARILILAGIKPNNPIAKLDAFDKDALARE